ncbi:MAG: hypothetical protein WCG47_12755 [Dermatophilaceae bacterium]
MARSQITLDPPAIGTAPCTAAGCKGAVGVPVWMWIDGGFPTRSATASVLGVTVTVTATMDRVDWSMGDGTTITCTTPGTRYTTALGWAQSPDCGHVYQQTSREQPGGTYPIVATARWTVRFTGAYQATTSATTTSQVNATIGEYQVVVVG